MYEDSVFGIISHVHEYDLDNPHLPPKITKLYGTGFCVYVEMPDNSDSDPDTVQDIPEIKNFLLTAAHLVKNAINIEIQFTCPSHISYTTIPASVLHINEANNIAVLACISPQYHISCLTLADEVDVSHIGGRTVLVGFPRNSYSISIHRGHTSDITYKQCANTIQPLIIMQTDIYVRPEYIGAPLVINGNVVGMCIETNINGVGSAFSITAPLIKNFLEQTNLSNKFHGIPWLPFTWRSLENDILRLYYNIPVDVTGIMLLESQDSCKLQKHDILTHIEGYQIYNDGKINYQDLHLPFYALLENKKLGDNIIFTIIRNGEQINVAYILSTTKSQNFRLRFGLKAKTPHFYLASGLVFQALAEGQNNTLPSECFNLERINGLKELIFLSNVIKSEFTHGYEELEKKCILVSFNKQQVNSIKHLITLVENSQALMHKFKVRFSYSTAAFKLVTPNLERDPAARSKFLTAYNIYCDRTPAQEDLLTVNTTLQAKFGAQTLATTGNIRQEQYKASKKTIKHSMKSLKDSDA